MTKRESKSKKFIFKKTEATMYESNAANDSRQMIYCDELQTVSNNTA